jgi:hypothetical protein
MQTKQLTVKRELQLHNQQRELESQLRGLGVDYTQPFSFAQIRSSDLSPQARYIKAVLQLEALQSLRQQGGVFLAASGTRSSMAKVADDSSVQELEKQIRSLARQLNINELNKDTEFSKGGQWWEVSDSIYHLL